MNKEEIAKQIEETEIKLKQLREALSEPKAGDLWACKNGRIALLEGNHHDGYSRARWLNGASCGMTVDIHIDPSMGDKRLGTLDEVFIRRDEVAKDYVLKADVLALTDFNDDSLADCIDKGFAFEGCPILHKQLTDLID
jgi:hypothetical protein